jgi:hypothetical protein
MGTIVNDGATILYRASKHGGSRAGLKECSGASTMSTTALLTGLSVQSNL